MAALEHLKPTKIIEGPCQTSGNQKSQHSVHRAAAERSDPTLLRRGGSAILAPPWPQAKWQQNQLDNPGKSPCRNI
ncbi:hypothetical protein MesoLj113b_68560 (plasmid) [Mesorhizobium sp. 113-3-3]|nr:hypothetical protein MesoLj113b_68560 [Mesorhizobium sp. 113-3-3]